MDQNLNPFEGEPVEQPVEKKKRYNFGSGIVLGFVLGMIITVTVSVIGIKIFVGSTGKAVVVGANTTTGTALIDQDTASKIAEINSYINAYYTGGEYDDEVLRDGLLHGLVSSLGDPYSEYYNPEEYIDFNTSTTGQYAGIGAGLAQDKNTMVVTVTKVYKGTPAEDAGLINGDIIEKVGDVDSTSMELSDLVELIRGEPGTTVTLKIYRESTASSFEVVVERKEITIPSVEYNMLPNHIGYIQVSQFQSNTSNEFSEAITDLKSQGMEKMIIDLRDNGGGLVSAVTEMLDTILPEGIVVYTEDKQGNRQNYTSDESCVDYPMVVLVNGNSASASEIFAGAIKDYKYGTLIGTNTFGKGIVQTIFPLSHNDGLKITTANYFTPNGNYIHKVGIAPDIELEYKFLGEAGEAYSQEYDNQLIYAQDFLNGNVH